MPCRIVVVGDSLLDRDVEGVVRRLAPDAPVPVLDDPVTVSRPGGAGLAALLCRLDGCNTTLVTALGGDAAGDELAGLLHAAGIEVVDLGLQGPTSEKIRVRAAGRSLVRVDRGGDQGTITRELSRTDVLAAADAVLVSDYGRGLAAEPSVRDVLRPATSRVPVVWDPHPKGPEPVPGARLVTPNASEAAARVPDITGHDLASITVRAERLARTWRAGAVAITLGARGALMVDGSGTPHMIPAAPAPGGDPCGAGDRFASAAIRLLAEGALASEAVAGAVTAASTFVASGGSSSVALREVGLGATREPRPRDAFAIADAARSQGRTVVATGGCFDLLHTGHISMLKAARALGDCLIVCLNSDDSVRRLKGSGRPLVPQSDRAAVLGALEGVDAVVIFDEDTPEAILERLRPDIWAKGADYQVPDLPEAAVVARWGGQAVVLPYLEGRSTTRLVEEVARRGQQ